jgi:hypothetical protein
MSLSDYYDRDGRRLTLTQWAELHSNGDYVRVAFTTVGQYDVSTVWLGLDHGWNTHRGDALPIIFETMVFDGDEDNYDRACVRYSTEAEARKGHEEMVTLIRATTEEASVEEPNPIERE